MRRRWLALLAACCLVIGAGGTYTGMKWMEQRGGTSQEAKKEQKEGAASGEDLSKVEQAYELIQNSYVEKVDDEQLVQGAIQGMIGTLKDPYSAYMDAEVAERFSDNLDSSFDGIGAQVTVEDGKLLIVAPIKNTPAEKAGLKPRDHITKIDGESVEGLDIYEATKKIRGKKGSMVKLEIIRKGKSKPFTVDIKREEVPVVTVFSDMKKMDGKNIGYLEITSFAEGTANEFFEGLEELENQKVDGLVIDVRGNPGGMLSSVEEIIQELVTDKKPYLQIEERNGNKNPVFSPLEEKKPYPISVLINEGSASASEILAGALNEVENYHLVGVRTFGKGTVQQAVPLEDGSNIKLTMFKWLTPDGNWIHNKGIEPTLKVEQPSVFSAHTINVERKLVRDMNGEEVKNAQELLAGLGYGPGRTDGYFDDQTERAVKAFQAMEKIKVTGEIDSETADRMEEVILSEIQDEKNDLQLQVAMKTMK